MNIVNIIQQIINHTPALQVLIPFIAALMAALSFNRHIAWVISLISSAIGLCLSLYFIYYTYNHHNISYIFGGWSAIMGIEYKIDILNQPIIAFINTVLLFFLIFGKEFIEKTILQYITNNKQYIFYPLILFAHMGYIGVISTNDLFNLYVFIEISSLATYVLIAQGKSSQALLGAFDYLILGTIGAALILIAIGFLLSLAGSLNITDILHILNDTHYTGSRKILLIAITFFLTGAILKTAFFPMHFWMIRAYNAVTPFMITYIGAISGVIGIYIILRFTSFAINIEIIQEFLSVIIRPISIITIIICSYLAMSSDNIKTIAIYSIAAQGGYAFLLLSVGSSKMLLIPLLMLDGLNKIGIFTIISHIEYKLESLRDDTISIVNDSIISIHHSMLFKSLVSFSMIFSAGLPFTSTFILKILIFEELLHQALIAEFILILVGSMLGLFYNFKFIKYILFTSKYQNLMRIDKAELEIENNSTQINDTKFNKQIMDVDQEQSVHNIQINHQLHGLIAIVTLQILSIFVIITQVM